MPTFNSLRDYQLALERRGRDAVPRLTAAADGLARELTRESKRRLQEEVYDIPEKTGPSGRKLWVRTGRLMGGESYTNHGPDIVHDNPTPYTLHRRNYGLPGHRPARPPQRSSQWYEDAQRALATRIHRVRRDVLLKLLQEG